MLPLLENHFYHIYNRGINSGKLFRDGDNYTLFLKKYRYYLLPLMETYAWCLMSNHFHFLVRILTKEEQEKRFNNSKNKVSTTCHGYKYREFRQYSASKQLGHLFNSYTRSFNSRFDRTGKLFEQPFRRKLIDDDSYLTHLICYIHRNPIHHKLTKDYERYPYSSYRIFLSETDQLINKEKILSLFGGKESFIAAHSEMKAKVVPEEYWIE